MRYQVRLSPARNGYKTLWYVIDTERGVSVGYHSTPEAAEMACREKNDQLGYGAALERIAECMERMAATASGSNETFV